MTCKLLEKRGASPTDITTASLAGVRLSNIYVGIFGKSYSKTTEAEYDEAVKATKPIFIYAKKMDERDESLSNLINLKIKPNFKMHQFSSNKDLYKMVMKNLEDFISELLKMGLKKFEENKQSAIKSEETAQVVVSKFAANQTKNPPRELLEDANYSLEHEDYLSTVMKSSIAFETWLRSKLDEKKLYVNKSVPLSKLVNLAHANGLLNRQEVNMVTDMRVSRNNAVHSGIYPSANTTKSLLHGIAHIINKRMLFSSSGEEETITRNFLCMLYYMSRNDANIEREGMRPDDIYEKLRLKALTDPFLIRLRIEKIIRNIISNGYIKIIPHSEKLKITAPGNTYCYSHCIGAPTP
jgi:hypothetical protein